MGVNMAQNYDEFLAAKVAFGQNLGFEVQQADVQTWLKPHQAAALQELVVALRDKRATMGDRREIRTAADAIRWMLEQIAVKRGWTC
jgi:hypothetical protein